MKARAVLEALVVYSLTLLCVALVGLSPVGEWERQVFQRNFIEYLVMIAVPLLILLVSRRNLASYGLTLRPLRYHLGIAAIAIGPVFIASFPLAFVDEKQWSGALVMSVVQIALLFTLGWLLKRKPAGNEAIIPVGAIMLVGWMIPAQDVTLKNAISAFIFYIFFLALGEELLFRGYIQSRLNLAWGRPFRFFGVPWGWGIIITSVLFGFMHVLNLGSLVQGEWQLAPWWGVWTFFGGMVLGYVREKTGSIAASTILHGLPQAIASAFLGI